ncbi:MAG: penicillin acylase family protein [Chitinophagales bacterium]|nr:penicillin acylase family protein [Chitinophagales bacterium]MDW8427591.1 penicillin acylase family protein [Chitinophagales bacterium]
MRAAYALLAALVSAALIGVMGFYRPPLPAIAPLLSPYVGLWHNFPSTVNNQTVKLAGLDSAVVIFLDSNFIPHVKARTLHDLYFAQGYLHARERLWQMEFLARVASGRLAEMLGLIAVPHDRQMRRFGLSFGAENSFRVVAADSLSFSVLKAYSDGVNAWISGLDAAAFPIEYKLLNIKPELWTPLKSLLIAKLMTYDLATLNDDYAMTAVLKKLGKATIDTLFPTAPFFDEPIIPKGTEWPFTARVPDVPDLIADTSGIVSDSFVFQNEEMLTEVLGSNNWAVSGKLTATGAPILCGDPHLRLSLPSLWYAMHLIGPRGWVAGASLVGTPGIIIGFNSNVAWSLTNVAPDVMDWYRIYFRNTLLEQYVYEDGYRAVSKRIEHIGIRHQKPFFDTVLYTHHGPIVAADNYRPLRSDVPPGCALRWKGHDGDNVVRTFLELNWARGYEDFVAALQHFECPAQNFVYADRQGTIALWVNGRFPLKWHEQGKYILDGRRRDHEWQGWIIHEHNPHIKNPARGFVSSANQQPTDSLYPYYLNWIFEVGTRGQRINQRLGAMRRITPDSMQQLQLDDLNLIAYNVLPVLLPMVQSLQKQPSLQEVIRILVAWNYRADSLSIAQTIFSEWWKQLQQLIWGDDFNKLAFPKTETTLRVILNEEKYRRWIDICETPEQETLPQVAALALQSAADSLRVRYGSDVANWRWGRVKQTTLLHSFQVPTFSRILSVSGDKLIVNAAGRQMGPSWRMVVALGDSIRAWWIYPGGQSGNPGSAQYDAFVEDWRMGRLRPFALLQPERSFKEGVAVITLVKS